jgi:hypothetical protein
MDEYARRKPEPYDAYSQWAREGFAIMRELHAKLGIPFDEKIATLISRGEYEVIWQGMDVEQQAVWFYRHRAGFQSALEHLVSRYEKYLDEAENKTE